MRFTLCLISGVLLGEAFSGGYFLPLGIFSALAVGLWVLKWLNPQSIFINYTTASDVLYLLLIIVFGWFRIAVSSQVQPNNTTFQLIQVSSWDVITSKGIITSTSVSAIGKSRLDIIVEETEIDLIKSKEKYNARLLFDYTTDALPGDTISFQGSIIPITDKRNPLAFDYKSFLSSRDIYVQFSVDSLIKVSQNNSHLNWFWWRAKLKKIVEQNFSNSTEDLANALILGQKAELDQQTKKAFSRAGLSHIMAVSGLHVGFLLAPIWFILPFFRRNLIGKYVGLTIVIIVLFLYSGLTNFSASVLRASVTAVFLTFGKLFNKSPNSINLTAAAAFFLLVINPSDLFSIGFQLSFSAVFIILLILPVIQSSHPSWIRFRWFGKPITVIIVSIVVQIGLYPIQAFYFGEVSLISPISNALFIPFLGLCIPLSFAGLIFTPISSELALFLSQPLNLLLTGMKYFVITISELEWSWMKVNTPTSLIFPFWLMVIFMISSLKKPAIRFKLINLSLLFLSVILFKDIYDKINPDNLTVTYFDVGQGDAALIQTPNGANVLIDTGVWRPGYSSGQSVLLPHLEAEGIAKLDAVVLSHPHADHIGGILDLVEGVPIDTIYNSGFVYESNLYKSYQIEAESQGIPIKSVQAGDIINIDNSVLLLILGPEGGRFNSDPNQHSIVLELIYGDTEFLFTGDADDSQEARIIENYGRLLNTDALKVAHHGSRTSSTEEFVNITSPDISVVSLGDRNRFKHPHIEAIQRINSSETELFYTSRDKAIILKSDGKKIWRLDWD